jgi:cyanophycinase
MLRSFGLCFTLAWVCFVSNTRAQSPAATPYKYFRVGSAKNAAVKPHAGYALMGGGTDLDEAFQWLCDRASGGDFLVLRATGTDAYNPYIQGLCKLNSVATLIVPTKEAAQDPFVAQTIARASALFIAGGDQANYINFWMGTPVQAALNDSIRRGVPIGGTSAGLAVLGEYAYSAQGDMPNDKDLDSKTTLEDPNNPRVTLVRGFLSIPLLNNLVTDTHFVKRDRMGRLLVFLARLNEPRGYPPVVSLEPVRGIGVDQGAAVLLDAKGKAKVIGRGNVYFLAPTFVKGELPRNRSLNFGDVEVQRVAPGGNFNLKDWRGDSTRYTLSVQAGVIHSSQPGGAIY